MSNCWPLLLSAVVLRSMSSPLRSWVESPPVAWKQWWHAHHQTHGHVAQDPTRGTEPPGHAAPAGPALHHPEEGSLFEGDIILHPGEMEWTKAMKDGPRARQGRNLVTSRRQLWPGGIVYYDWGPEFTNYTQRYLIQAALSDLEVHTCVRFQRRSRQKTYLLLRNTRSGCAAPVGYVPIGRPIDVFLGQPGCQRRGTVQHEFLHTLGFWHEHTRPDRDNHVTVHWRNILQGLEFNFSMRPSKEVQYLDMPYDYDSVMHYRSLAFSKDGRSHTIVPKDTRALKRIGQRERFSRIDLAKLNRLYNCPQPYYRGDDVSLRKRVVASPAAPPLPGVAEPSTEAPVTETDWPGPYPLPTESGQWSTEEPDWSTNVSTEGPEITSTERPEGPGLLSTEKPEGLGLTSTDRPEGPSFISTEGPDGHETSTGNPILPRPSQTTWTEIPPPQLPTAVSIIEPAPPAPEILPAPESSQPGVFPSLLVMPLTSLPETQTSSPTVTSTPSEHCSQIPPSTGHEIPYVIEERSERVRALVAGESKASQNYQSWLENGKQQRDAEQKTPSVADEVIPTDESVAAAGLVQLFMFLAGLADAN